MAAPSEQVEFGIWLERRLEELGMDPDVYPAYIQSVLEEEDSEEETGEALRGILGAILVRLQAIMARERLGSIMEEDSIDDVCLEIVTRWSECQKAKAAQTQQADEIQALATMIEKQAQIVVKAKEVSSEEQQRKAALLAQYANVTDDEEGEELEVNAGAAAPIGAEKSLFKNTNLEDIMNARKVERDALRDASHKKKEQDKQQRDKDKVAKQERKDKEKKRTQKGERKR